MKPGDLVTSQYVKLFTIPGLDGGQDTILEVGSDEPLIFVGFKEPFMFSRLRFDYMLRGSEVGYFVSNVDIPLIRCYNLISEC